MTDLTSVGNVIVTETGWENPYTYSGPFRSGPKRAASLRALRDGGDTAGLVFWHAPANGGARKITSADQVDWRGMQA